MTKKKIAELIERAKRNEKLPLHQDDEMVRAHVECLLEEWKQRLPLSEDDREVLMELAKAFPFPGRHGRFPKSEEAREAEAQALAQVLTRGREHKAELKREGFSAAEATDRTVSELKRLYPKKSLKTIKGLLQRRP